MKFCDLIIVAGCLTVASQASAASLGASQGSVILGAPIDLYFEVQGDGPQALAENECVSAQVWLGDMQLPSHQVRIAPRSHQVRLQTTTVVNEPLVTIKLTAGCASTIARSYTLFADPPKSLAAVQTPIDLQKISVTPLAQTSTAYVTPKTPTTAAKTAKTPTPAKVSKPKPKPKPRASEAPEKVSPPPPAATPAAADNAGKPTLRLNPVMDLDASTPTLTTTATTAASAALAASNATSESSDIPAPIPDANAQRLEALEQQLQKLQEQLRTTHTETDALRAQLVKANAAASATPTWIYVVLGLLALALACIAWLLQRLKQEQEKAQQAWSHAVAAQSSLSINTSALPNADRVDAVSAVRTVQATPVVQPHATPAEPLSGIATASTAQASFEGPTSQQAQDLVQLLTAQALLEVQEEAEFYASIGENDQAIDLLQAHIEAHANTSPQAYLELLQLLHRLSRTEAFERIRAQFEQHFSVKVPEFLSFANKGGDLWSHYPEVLEKIEAAWPSEAIEILLRDLILHHESQNGQSDMRFELAAFDDLLMLYNLAKSTTAAERGVMEGRKRSSLAQAPLPDLQQSTNTSLQAPDVVLMPEDIFAASADSAATAGQVQLSISDMALDAPSATSATAQAPTNDSPFKDTSHFRPDEILMDSLTLDWNAAPRPDSQQPNPSTNDDLDLQPLPSLSPLPPVPPTK